MTGLHVRLYLDEDVSVVVARILLSHGHQATTTLTAGRLGSSDSDQLEFATSRHQVIVTHNRIHFESLAQEYFAQGRDHAGIIIAVRRTPSELAKRLLAILDQRTSDEMCNQVVYV